MADPEAKRRGNLKLVLILGSAGMLVGTVNILANARVPTPGVSITGAAILFALAIAFAFFLGGRSPVGRAALSILPELRVYVALIAMLLVLCGAFRTMAVLGVDRAVALIVMIVVLLCGYLVAMFPKAEHLLSSRGYPKRGVHAIFGCLLATTVLSLALVVT